MMTITPGVQNIKSIQTNLKKSCQELNTNTSKFKIYICL